MRSSDRCRLFKGIFGVIFAKLRNPADRKILEKWVLKE